MNAKFLLDENMPFALTEFLKKKGCEAKRWQDIREKKVKTAH